MYSSKNDAIHKNILQVSWQKDEEVIVLQTYLLNKILEIFQLILSSRSDLIFSIFLKVEILTRNETRFQSDIIYQKLNN